MKKCDKKIQNKKELQEIYKPEKRLMKFIKQEGLSVLFRIYVNNTLFMIEVYKYFVT